MSEYGIIQLTIYPIKKQKKTRQILSARGDIANIIPISEFIITKCDTFFKYKYKKTEI